MHSLCLGVTKRLLELTFNVGEKRYRRTTRKLSSRTDYNILINSCQVPREFSRRCRNLDLSVMKAQEYRNVVLFFFLFVIQCIPNTFSKEISVWLCLAFITRACILPNNEFETLNHDVIEAHAAKFYHLYQDVFGEKNCTCLLYTSPSPRDRQKSRMPSSA